jgi:hypothetical protein
VCERVCVCVKDNVGGVMCEIMYVGVWDRSPVCASAYVPVYVCVCNVFIIYMHGQCATAVFRRGCCTRHFVPSADAMCWSGPGTTYPAPPKPTPLGVQFPYLFNVVLFIAILFIYYSIFCPTF